MFSGVRAFVVAATVIIDQTIAATIVRVAVICGAQTVDVNVWAYSRNGVKFPINHNRTTLNESITARCHPHTTLPATWTIRSEKIIQV